MTINIEYDYETKPITCWNCGKINDISTGGPKKPKPADISVCFGCQMPGFFTEQATLIEPTAEQFIELSKNEELQTLIKTIKKVKKEN